MKYYYRKYKYIILAGLIDAISGISRLFRLKQPGRPKEIHKILIIRNDQLGDMLYALPAIALIRKTYPKAMISLLAAPGSKELLEGNADLNEIIYSPATFVNIIKLGLQIRKNRFDMALDLKGHIYNILLMLLSNAKYKISYNDVGGKYLIEKSIPRRLDLSALMQNEYLLRNIGITDPLPAIDLGISDRIKENVELIMRQLNLSGKNVICLHCGAGRESKRWGLNNFNRLIGRLNDLYPECEIAIIGGKNETAIFPQLSAHSKPPINLIGAMRIKELFVFLQRVSLFIGNDSFPAHLAGLAGIPTIVFFSNADDPRQWKPIGSKVVVIQKEPHSFIPLSSRQINKSLLSITVNDVIEKAKEMLK